MRYTKSSGHPFFVRLNGILTESGFDGFVERLCSSFYADRLGRPSLRPGRYFRLLFIGYFEGLSSERGIAWRVADSLSLRSFLDLEVTEASPDHSTGVADAAADRRGDAPGGVHVGSGSEWRKRVWYEGKRSAWMRRRWKRTRRCGASKKTSNEDWRSPQDPDAKVAKMKDGRTHLAHKVEHGVDLETGAILGVTVQDASEGDSATLPETLTEVPSRSRRRSRRVRRSP